MHRPLRTVLLLIASVCAAATVPASVNAEVPPTVTATQPLTPRLTEWTMTTPALAEPTHVRVLLPDGYAEHPERRYPVLYLLHGAFDDYRSWSDKGAAEAITAGAPLIVVMPDAGPGGWYTDWVNQGRGGPPAWERFHLGQLVPWVDATFRTVAAREGRAVAGLSMGGFGALSYAARHPDTFVYGASFSGAADIINNAPVAAIIGLEAGAEGALPGAQFGDRVAEEIRWRAHNPWDLAQNLRGMRLRLATGNGQRGPSDEPGPPDPIEQQVREMTVSLHRKLESLGIAHAFDDYGAGIHDWPYWQRDLRRALPEMLDAFAHPPARLDPLAFTAAERSYTSDGWSVSFADAALAFSTLRDAGRQGFTLEGRGRATVMTPGRYPPGSRHEVDVAGSASTATADGAGRLRFQVVAPAKVRIDEAPLSGLPDSTTRRCTSRRRIDVHLRPRRGLRVRSVEVRIDGRRTLRRRGSMRTVVIDLRGRRAGTYKVVITVRGRRGGRALSLTTRRAYRTCG
jgi:diacylglycerol O-acyltransferase/trehalose O-mycolyltransferase